MASNILLLQGPMGPFFTRLATDLESCGSSVYKINFNAGDRYYFSGRNCKDFTDHIDNWPAYLEFKLKKWEINSIYLFGDERVYHRQAHEVAKRLGIDVFVFEEGYLRPHYITLEKDGVNGRSSIPRDPEAYADLEPRSIKHPDPVPYSFFHMAWFAIVYFCTAWLGRKDFPHYLHHRAFNPFVEAGIWIRAGYRKIYYKFRERGVLRSLTNEHSKAYFLSPLQVHNDAQIKTWSSVPSAAAFIRRLVSSFAKNAPADTLLVIKHHPLDRGYSDYSRLIKKLEKKFNCEGRVYYVHDLHLPTLLDHARGTVLLNSTVGISSILHGTPVKTSGHAIYNIEGLTHQGKMADFWRAPGSVDKALNQKFRNYLKMHNQINGNFYRKIPGQNSHSGIDFSYLLALAELSSQRTKQQSADTKDSLAEPRDNLVPLSIAAAEPAYQRVSQGTPQSSTIESPAMHKKSGVA